MKKVELLSPAGNMEALKAAICAGCDAVYLGGTSFGARSFAINFTNEELKEAVTFAHLYQVKVYVTLNTLIYEHEISDFCYFVDYLVSIHVDAVIMQDLGALYLVHQMYPELEIHASTQMHIHNIEGIKLVEQLGVKRVVLARELDIDAIRDIRMKTSLEMEIFVHGALCVSYSGLCLMSSMIGGRSGNRGACAGTCRRKYTLIRKRGRKDVRISDTAYLLSCKDLNTLDHLKELLDSGVDSLKIEGRMKRASYVYMVTSLYRKAIDAYYRGEEVTITKEEITNLMKIYYRGFTKGYLFHEKNSEITNSFRPNHMGVGIGKVVAVNGNKARVLLTDLVCRGDGVRILGKNDVGCTLNVIYQNHKVVTSATGGSTITITLPKRVEVGDKVVKTTDQNLETHISMLIKKGRAIPIRFSFTAKQGSPLMLKATCGADTVFESSSVIPSKAMNRPITRENIEEKLSRLGETVYQVEAIDITIDENIFFPISALNELRRKTICALNEKRLFRKVPKRHAVTLTPPTCQNQKGIYLEVYDLKMYDRVKSFPVDGIYVSESIYDFVKDDPKVIPVILHVKEKPRKSSSALVGELGSFYNSSGAITDTSFNVVNSYTLALLFLLGAKRVTLSFELTPKEAHLIRTNYIKRYGSIPNIEWVGYGKVDMMISKFLLPEKYHIDTFDHLYLRDQFQNDYPIRILDDKMILYYNEPRISMPSILEEEGVSLRLRFVDETDFVNGKHELEKQWKK